MFFFVLFSVFLLEKKKIWKGVRYERPKDVSVSEISLERQSTMQSAGELGCLTNSDHRNAGGKHAVSKGHATV